jgi:phage-related protein
VSPKDKPLVWLHGEVKSPPLSKDARLETGYLLRRLQRGDLLGMPLSRPMPTVGARCHELRINDSSGQWRLMYRLDSNAIVILEFFAKKSQTTPKAVIVQCKRRLKEYEHATKQTKEPRR